MESMNKVRTDIIVTRPFWAGLAVRLVWKEREDMPVMFRTDGKHLWFNPERIKDLHHSHKRFGALHEIFHVSNGHLFRRKGRDPQVWNEACDHMVNIELVKSGEEMPEGLLYDLRFDGMSPERIYDILLSEKNSDSEQQQGEQGEQGMPEGQNAPQNSDTGSESQPDNGEQQEQGSKGQQDGSEQGEDAETEGEAGDADQGQPSDPASTSRQYDNGQFTGDFVDPVSDDGDVMTEAEMQKAETEWIMATNQAARIADGFGQCPGNLKSMAKDMLPKQNWKRLLRQFCDSRARNKSNWMRPERRLVSHGVHMPSKHGKRLPPFVIALDTSGSLLHQQAELLAEVQKALQSYPIEKIYVLHVDTAVRHVDIFTKGSKLEIKQSYGGGGTDLTAPFKWMEEQKEHFLGMVYITDLMGPKPEKSSIKTLWLSTVQPSRASRWLPKFGTVAYLD